ncbi:hypothetical protein [Mangrovihabitans endophyticus]|uniref:Uncharacterized protein n=1 Tax=Mangrovihabitans endophyticus TaxID=1751298 RepID=A0A8J3FMN4_9ACTN|nr:hypothetical protein [Mangrovihabitans endophyticus]GGK77347.1 hypothetical protein GCM10012284_09230 [Mangrovihabitans endophyticus]
MTDGEIRLVGAARPQDWAPVTPARWRFADGEVVLAESGRSRPGPRRPFEYALLAAGPEFSAVRIDARVRTDEPVTNRNRDVIVVFGHRSDTRFYYAHLCADNTIYPHNGVFKVHDADRERIDDQWDGRRSRAAPAITDDAWHHVTVRHHPATGRIAVHLDGDRDPLLTATDRTFGAGRVGFGSFDDIGRCRDFRVRGTPAR